MASWIDFTTVFFSVCSVCVCVSSVIGDNSHILYRLIFIVLFYLLLLLLLLLMMMMIMMNERERERETAALRCVSEFLSESGVCSIQNFQNFRKI